MLFAHLKRILKLDRLRLRGLTGAHDEFLSQRQHKICDEWRSGSPQKVQKGTLQLHNEQRGRCSAQMLQLR